MSFRKLLAFALCCGFLSSCAAADYRQRVDASVGRIIEQKQLEALGHGEPFSLASPEDQLRRRLLLTQDLPRLGPSSLGTRYLEAIPHWPEQKGLPAPGANEQAASANPETLTLSLLDALKASARNSREYQNRKEEVFRSALALDLERHAFGNSFAGVIEGSYETDRSDAGGAVSEGVAGSVTGSVSRALKNGMTITAMIGMDLVRLLTPGHDSANSLFGDASISIPLLRGAGRHIAAEPLTQAERDALYSIWAFERFKQQFAVRVVESYLAVLQAANQLANQEENYRGLITSSRRAQRLAEAGKLPQVQVDQAVQSELRTRDRWITARQQHARALDQLKILMGLPTDAAITLDRQEFSRLEQDLGGRMAHLFQLQAVAADAADASIVISPPDRAERGPYEYDPDQAIRLALANRLDIRELEGRVFDAQRQVVVAADQLRAELTLLGSASVGERRTLASAASGSSSRLDLDRGVYNALLTMDLPFDRVAEAINYRDSFISLEQAARAVQELEDQIKLQVRNNLRDLEQARASLTIQYRAVKLAEHRVRGSELALQAGRSQVRDVLDSRDSLLIARNALTSAMVAYRLAELALQRDAGVLAVDSDGLWREYVPEPEKQIKSVTP